MSELEPSQDAVEAERGVAPAIATTVAVAALAFGVVLVMFDEPTLLPVVFAVGAVFLGVVGGIRGAVASGVFGFAVASVVAAHEASLSTSLALHCVTVAVCFGLILGAEMSFSARRNTVVEPGLPSRVLTDHVELLALGVLLGALVVVATTSVSLPGWLVVVPVVALVVGAIAGYRELKKRRVALLPPPPRVQDLRRPAVRSAGTRPAMQPPPPGSVPAPRQPPPPIPMSAPVSQQQPPPPAPGQQRL